MFDKRACVGKGVRVYVYVRASMCEPVCANFMCIGIAPSEIL